MCDDRATLGETQGIPTAETIAPRPPFLV